MKFPTVLIAAALLSWGGAAVAAQPPQQSEYAPPNPGQQQGQQQVTDTQLKQFSQAMAGVYSVQQEYSEQIRQAEDMERAQSLRADAQQEMRSAVEDSGLSIAEYNRISQQLQSDPELAQRLQEIGSP